MHRRGQLVHLDRKPLVAETEKSGTSSHAGVEDRILTGFAGPFAEARTNVSFLPTALLLFLDRDDSPLARFLLALAMTVGRPVPALEGEGAWFLLVRTPGQRSTSDGAVLADAVRDTA